MQKLKAGYQWLLLILFGLASLGQLQRLELPLSRAIYLHEIVILLILVLGFRKKLLPRSLFYFNLWTLLSIGLLALGGVSLLSPLLYLLRFDAYLLLGLTLMTGFRRKLIHHAYLWWLVVGSIGIIAILGWLQYFFLPDTRFLFYLSWDDHYLRLISTLFDPGFTGAVLVLGALTVQSKLSTWAGKHGAIFSSLQGILILILSALLFTYSRASFIAYAIGGVILFWRQRKNIHLMILVILAALILILPRGKSEGVRLERTASITARTQSMWESLPSNAREILIGKGWYGEKLEKSRVLQGNVLTSHNSAPDNSFLFIFSSLGIVGLLLFFWVGYSLGRLGHWSSLTLSVLGAMSIHALFSNTFLYPFVLLFLVSLIALENNS